MKTPKLAWILGCAACALPACGSNQGTSSDDYLSAAPELSALQLSVTDDAASENTATDTDAVDAAEQITEALAESSDALTTQVAPELAHAREAVSALNQALRNFMQPIVALVRNTEPSTLGRVRTWGPVTRGATEYQFVMRRGTLRHFGWTLQARPAGTTENYAVVAAGGITVGYAVRRGIGTVGIDLDRLGALDPTVVARGSLLASFAHGPNGSALVYRLRDFSADPAQKSPISAIVQGVHLKPGVNRLRLAYYGNVADTASDAPELVLARVRQERAEGGRADLLATGGDIADGNVWIVSECWGAALQSTYRIVRDCPKDDIGGSSCDIVSTTGDLSACPHDLDQLDLPPTDPLAGMSDPQSPEGDLTPPTSMPDGEPPTS
jgi:hypothetical protein